MSDAAKKAYIKKHGEAPGSAGDDEPKVPAPDSKSDTGKPRVSANPYDDNYGQEVDDEDDYDMGEVPMILQKMILRKAHLLRVLLVEFLTKMVVKG